MTEAKITFKNKIIWEQGKVLKSDRSILASFCGLSSIIPFKRYIYLEMLFPEVGNYIIEFICTDNDTNTKHHCR